MKRPAALDLFSGAGGTAAGLLKAGFNTVVGIDNRDQPNYAGTHFYKRDVLAVTADQVRRFDFVWASPPCQRFSVGTHRWPGRPETHGDFVAWTRALLEEAGVPWVMENVPRAPLRKDLMLCGFMFGLKTVRHRIFELEGFVCPQPEHPSHKGRGKRGDDYFTVAGHPGGFSKRDQVRIGSFAEWQDAMGIDWMTAKELVEAVPPAYADWIGTAFLYNAATK